MKQFFKKFQKGDLPKSRIESLSDGIFAIVLTLLVLEIKLPLSAEQLPHTNKNLIEGLKQIGPQIMSWVSSFLMVAVFWVNHHNILSMAKRINYAVIWINTFFLLVISFAPFPTGILGKYTGSPVAVTFFALVMFVAGLIIIILRDYIVNCLQEGPISHKHTLRSIFFGPFLYILAIVFSWTHISVSYFILLFIPFYFMIPQE